jgi:glucokinase
MALTIGVDVGGTKVAGGLVDDDGAILARLQRATPTRASESTRDAIIEVIRELSTGSAAEAVGVGAAGFVDEKRASVLFAPNVPGWRNEPLRDVLERELKLPVVVENDANAAAWGEAEYGAGRGEDFLVVVTVGTGIGGGIILDGELFRGRYGVAGEIGHLVIEANGRPCGCGNRGCWEQYASGNALLREARWRAAESRDKATVLLDLGDGTPEGVSGVDVTEAARKGDPVATESFESVGRWLGLGLADLAAVLDPGRFVIGGGVSAAGDLLLAPARRAFAESLTGRGQRPVALVLPAELGNAAGIVGAAALARRR